MSQWILQYFEANYPKTPSTQNIENVDLESSKKDE